VIEVEETTVTDVPAVPPKLTVAPVTKPVPVIVTRVPPAVGPAAGLRDVTVGAGDVTVTVGQADTNSIEGLLFVFADSGMKVEVSGVFGAVTGCAAVP
jgi:hypothetical protein